MILIYGSDWCYDCRRTKKFLTTNAIPFDWVDIEKDQEGERFVLEANRGMRSIPTLVFEDGTLMVEPSNRDLAQKLGIKSPV
jgi:glutaredoxin